MVLEALKEDLNFLVLALSWRFRIKDPLESE
jgi:hypothetical protein